MGFFVSACAARTFTPPTDAGVPLPDLAQVQAQVFRACAGVRTLQAELGLVARVGSERLRGPVHAGFERPSSMRLEGVAPFGAPWFILVSRGDAATLLLPRDARVVRGRPEQILGELTGVSLAPDDLLAVLTGCVMPSPQVEAGRLHGNRMASLDLAGGATIYLRRVGSVWQPVAARREGWMIEYRSTQGTFPDAVTLRGTSDGLAVDLRATLSQIETNTDFGAETFQVTVPADAQPMSIDELREAGPLRGAR